MSTWALLGGPQHGATASGPVPSGYQFEAAGSQYGPIYEPTVRQADEVYRWSDDVAYLVDGERILEAVQNGTIGFPEEIPTAAINQAFSALNVTLGVLRSNPDMDEAQMARESVDAWRHLLD